MNIICKQCGVELDEGMKACPLCGRGVSDTGHNEDGARRASVALPIPENQKRHLLQRVLWQITSVLLLSGIVSTMAINLSIQGTVSWSIYPVTVCSILLFYALLLSRWPASLITQLLVGWVLSIILLAVLGHWLSVKWPMSLALPILSVINALVIVVVFVGRLLQGKKLNLIAVLLFTVALLCLTIDGIISHYQNGAITLTWSAIVAACLLPVTGAILFMHYRTKNNPELQKIFHT